MLNWALGIFSSLFPSNDEEPDHSILQAAGPVSVVCSIIVSLILSINFDLLFLGILGLILCFASQMRGLAYSLILLSIDAVIKHAFFIDWHFWQLGIEASMAAGWTMTACTSEWVKRKERTLIAQLDSKKQTISNLEEDLTKARQDALDEQMNIQERLTVLQKELDERQSEAASLQILNDVLRKTSAQTTQEREEVGQKYLQKDQEAAKLQSSIDQLKQESALLMETIAEREFDLNRLQEQMHDRQRELTDRLTVFEKELQTVKVEKEDGLLKLQQADESLRSLLGVQTEKEEALGKLQSAEVLVKELSEKQTVIENEKFSEKLLERDEIIKILQERVQTLSQKESQYLELKKQFEDKNVVLHHTRAQLFQADTALQALKMEMDAKCASEPLQEEQLLLCELVDAQLLVENLEQENADLFDLVSVLSREENPEEKILTKLAQAAKKKKKKKKKAIKKEEEPLFEEALEQNASSPIQLS